MNNFPDDNEHCFCYPDGQLPTVQQLLDSQNVGQERLVIYLYKNGITNEVKMYTPKANKQVLIPDIPFDAGDGLVTVTTENLNTLLYNNPHKIKVYNDYVETLVPSVTDSMAIGLNTGAIEHIYPNDDNYLNPNNNYKGNEYSLGNNIALGNEPSGGVVNEPQDESTYIPDNVFPEPYDNSNLSPKQYKMTNNYPYINLDDSQAIPLEPEVAPGNSQAIPLNPQTIEDPLSIQINPQSSTYKLQVTPINAQFIQSNPQAIPDKSRDYLDSPQAIPSNPQALPESYAGGLDPHVVYTFQPVQGSNKLHSGSQDINNPMSSQYLTFNMWFNQQMKRFQNINLPNYIKTVDSNVLKTLVQKTFHENNIYVSTDGVITDAKGIVIDAANLELRPLLLGETFSHQILQNAHKVIKLPKHLPYLEGILVTLVSPPTILGIIPLGKTYLPETTYAAKYLGGLNTVNGTKVYLENYRNAAYYSSAAKAPYTLAYKQIYAGPTNYYTYSAANAVPISGNSNLATYSKPLPLAYPPTIGNKEPQERNYWSSGPYQTVSKLQFPTANWNLSELKQLLGQRREFSDAKIEHLIEPLIIRNKKKGKGRNKPTRKNVSAVTAEPFPNFNSSESGRRFPTPSLTGIMKTLLYLLNDVPSRRGLNSSEEVDVVNESEKSNDGEGPDFRIIGGSAATGSGTPVNNKGRSGITEYA